MTVLHRGVQWFGYTLPKNKTLIMNLMNEFKVEKHSKESIRLIQYLKIYITIEKSLKYVFEEIISSEIPFSYHFSTRIFIYILKSMENYKPI